MVPGILLELKQENLCAFLIMPEEDTPAWQLGLTHFIHYLGHFMVREYLPRVVPRPFNTKLMIPMAIREAGRTIAPTSTYRPFRPPAASIWWGKVQSVPWGILGLVHFAQKRSWFMWNKSPHRNRDIHSYNLNAKNQLDISLNVISWIY